MTPSKQIKNEAQYQELRKKGASKEKAARIANAKNAGEKGGEADKYEERSKEELYQKAREIGIEGRSNMDKEELIKALRNR